MSHIISQYAIRLTLFCIMLCSIATFRPSRRIFIFCFSPGERRPPKKRSTFFLVRIGRLNLLLSSTVVRHYGLLWHPTRRLRRLNGIAVADVIMNPYLQSATEKKSLMNGSESNLERTEVFRLPQFSSIVGSQKQTW